MKTFRHIALIVLAVVAFIGVGFVVANEILPDLRPGDTVSFSLPGSMKPAKGTFVGYKYENSFVYVEVSRPEWAGSRKLSPIYVRKVR